MSIYLDNAATTFPKPESVYRAVEHAIREIGVGPGRSGHRRGVAASRLVFDARELLASFFGVKDSARIVFTHSATEAINLALSGVLHSGDHVVTTTMEHNSLARPLHQLEQRGVKVTWVKGDRTGYVSSRRIAAAIGPSTRMVALSHCSNVTGTIQPIAEIGELTRKSGALLLVDAAQSAGMLPIDVGGLNIDLLAVTGHKGLMGPQGTGLLFIAEGAEPAPLLVGGTGVLSSSLEQPVALPERFESGTLNTPGIAGLKAGVEFVQSTGLAAIREHKEALVLQLLEGLAAIPGITLYGPGAKVARGAVVSFNVDGMDPSHIGYRLDQEYDIAVRVGLHCAPLAHRTIGSYPVGTVRVSPGFFTSGQDITAFLAAIRAIAAK